MDYGYVRVSSRDQNAARQLDALVEAGLDVKNIAVEKQSGKDFDRAKYKSLLKKLKPGDTVFIKELDRLGRNYSELLKNWRTITEDKKANVVVLDMPLLDTRKRGNDLTGRFIADLVLQILSYVAETERKSIHQRQAEGIASAKARGVRFGNPGKPVPSNFSEIVEQWKSHKISIQQAFDILDVGRSYFFRKIKELHL